MRKLLLFTLILCFIASAADAQRRRTKHRRSTFNRKKPPYRYELIGSIGATNFLGDLGGADQIGTNGLKDLELILTRPAASIGMRVKVQQFITVKNNLYFGIVRGDDKLTKEPFRNHRNLNFKSPILELSTQLEFNFIKEQKGHIYNIKGVRGLKHKDRQMYLFGGGGLFYFNPRGKYNGKWYSLQPLGTEGQGIIAGTRKYFRINALISVGGGMRFAINRYWGIGLELGMRKTFTDYIDDVSTEYPGKAIFTDPLAAALSDPSLTYYGPGGTCSTCSGTQRGDTKDKDAYMFAVFTVGYKVMYRKRSRSKF